MLDHFVEVAVAGDGELDADPEAPDQRMTRAETAEGRDSAASASQPVVVLCRLQGDVVPEPLRLLVRVGVTANVDQERRVVHSRTFGLAEPHTLRDPQRDEALAQDVLHGLSEPKVDTERKRRNQFGKADMVGAVMHAITIQLLVIYQEIPRDTPAAIAQAGRDLLHTCARWRG